ncbi:OmpA family protein [Flavobacterium hercynium]|uniref:Flagellar motor protein MotB n=1 Tax=Flavobacterium hercynium TaxID=387094 RepID=A0A226GQX6_9FLAO|nr:OmpA family protein [Flavobacterium hercynium]OXA84094.1 flagellar motor protein MotB [Flavobacterium hercynium]SMP20849.1 WD40-like Beta Propeller Repeat [Flavobacterium hercynium]
MKIKNLKYSLVLSFSFLYSLAQNIAGNKAEENYNKNAYIDAITIYEKIAERGYKEEKMFQRIGNSYYFNAELTKAVKWYDQLFSLNTQQEPEYYFRYSQALKSIGDYEKADKMRVIFNKMVKARSESKESENNANYLNQIRMNSGRFEVSDAGINSNESDYGSTIYNNKLVFASARDTGVTIKRILKWTNKPFTNLYTAEIKEDGSLGTPVRFDKEINSKFNESTPVFTKDGKTMYFTRNNFLDGKRGRNDKRITLLKIYRATWVKNEWSNIIEVPFNSDQYSVAHPSLSPDDKKLYFASDMPGGLGQSDLYSVVIKEDGTFEKPENLGPTINTEGRETFPFFAGDNELYFASDGRPGLGGLDVFVAKAKESGFEPVQNVGEPVNTKFDDFGYIIDSGSRQGYFSSNKEDGIGNDDIYKFTETRRLVCEKKLSGLVLDSQTNEVLKNSKVILFDDKFEKLAEIVSADGAYSFDLKCYSMYHIRAIKEDYETNEVAVSVHPFDDKSERDIKLDKQIQAITIGTDLAKILNIPIVYFGFDQSNIKKEAAFELEKVLAVLQQYPTMKIDVRSHTDSRQTENYNMKLSEKRAKATIDWFIKKGIDPARITGRGYGESRLINKCADNVKCTEEEHKLNRRSEFVILSFQ